MSHNLRQAPLIALKMLAEAGAICLSSFLAFYLRFDGRIPASSFHLWQTCLPTLIVCRLAAGYAVTSTSSSTSSGAPACMMRRSLAIIVSAWS